MFSKFVGNADDGWVDGYLPFPFPFYGTKFGADTVVRVSTNGYFTLGDDPKHFSWGGTTPIPSARRPNSFVAVYWADLDPGAGKGKIYISVR